MIPVRALLLLATAVPLLASCATPTAPGVAGRSSEPQGSDNTRTLIAAIRAEPTSIAGKPVLATGIQQVTTRRFFNAGLAILDEREVAHPYLSPALPQLNTDSWRVFPDGRMETTYQLRPDLSWHDGTPLTADDFVFAWRVYAAPDLGFAASPPHNQLDEVVAVDPRTVVFRWGRLYADAGALDYGRLPALPRHILEETFRQERYDIFSAHPYWTTEFVGLGPFQLERWESGGFLEGSAFGAHAEGRPRIGRIRLVFISDANTLLANLLAEAVHASIDDSIRFQQAIVLRQEWGARSGGVVFAIPTQIRHTQVQFRSELVTPKALLDLRVRKALAHAIDKQALVDGLFDGEATIADTLISPRTSFYAAVDRTLTKYPYDLRRTEQLMNEAGFARADGVYSSAIEGRFSSELRVLASPQNEAEQAIMAEGLGRSGFDIRSYIVPAPQVRDGQVRATFPGLSTTSEPPINNLTSYRIPRPENRWQGANYGGWSSAEWDRLFDAFNSALDPNEREGIQVRMAKLASEELPEFYLYFNPVVTAHVAALLGPLSEATTAGGVSWNVHRWHWR